MSPTAENPPPRQSSRAIVSPRALVGLCAAIVVVAAVVRLWVAAAGWFYWDDLILHSLAAGYSRPSPEFLLTDHDGHLMPGGMALVWIAAHFAPLDFRLPLAQIVVLQLLAGAAYARMLWVLLRGRPVLLVPLVAGLAIPLGLTAATWWAAALNVLPLSAALAWAVSSMVLLARTGHRRHAVEATLATVLGLLFVEKALIIPVVAATVLLAGWWTAGGGRAEILDLWRRTRVAWAAQAVIVVVWAGVFVVVVGRLGGRGSFGEAEGTRPGFVDLVAHTYRLAVVPALGGGPWRWDRWHPGPPMADPPVAAVAVGVLACAAVLTWSLLTRRRTGAIWLVAALYPLISVVLVAAGRAGPDTAAEIVQTLRYHAELPVILGAAAALALAAPRRTAAPTHTVVGVLALIALLASSVVSTVTFRQVWSEQPSRDYVQPLVETLRDRPEPMLDQDVPFEVLHPVTAPAHRLSTLITGVPGMPEVGTWTPEPVLVDALGALHPAEVAFGRTLPQGPEPACGHRVGPDGARLELDDPLLERDWVVQLNVFADADGLLALGFDQGEETVAPVRAGLGTVFVRVEGGGTGLTVSPRGGVTEMCVGSGPVGVLVPR
ncbi:hypothetical protein K3888_08745 [Dietzia aurantiaca]|uniref:hypothetical protein n=1 Tax=Dietzia aurantiaca TaxID=983873 RepID=UPI001E5158EE|nr:hypothetical protein [Dietzia aurantiaca]MCD2262788.1 hypothetical protein [Dietzia aurantiaca]